MVYFLSAERVTTSTGFLDKVQTEKLIHLFGYLCIYLCLFQIFFHQCTGLSLLYVNLSISFFLMQL